MSDPSPSGPRGITPHSYSYLYQKKNLDTLTLNYYYEYLEDVRFCCCLFVFCRRVITTTYCARVLQEGVEIGVNLK